ncbi:helix-turn-helix transcriptional regulator [Desulfosporosinus sp. FKB]|uniref:helix-turn-helix domain-containing protein n=1 Tax=Desulfosporosinus sp. FKB TaxID=1969835 RepID=UPI000B4A3C0F|nr:helix-turn-helix transcriptional regulator [Desulfosporosinus sp. FKB]
MPELGKKLKEIRLTKGLSAKELSIRSGVARSLISQLETGKRQSTGIDTISRLALALEVSPTVFLSSDSLPTSLANLGTSEDSQNNQEPTQFTLKEESRPYLRVVQKAEEAGLSPDLLEDLLDIIVKLRSESR